MAKLFPLEIITPERTFFSGSVISLTVEAANGRMGILADHEPYVVGLDSGMLKIQTADKELVAAHGEGFVEVRPDKTLVLCQTAEYPDEIEPNRVRRAIEEHERKLREAKSMTEYNLSKATLSRAFARLRVKGNG